MFDIIIGLRAELKMVYFISLTILMIWHILYIFFWNNICILYWSRKISIDKILYRGSNKKNIYMGYP